MRGVSASTSESAVLLIPEIPKKAKRPGLVKVKRSRSTSLRTSRPSTTAEVNFFAMSDVFNQSIYFTTEAIDLMGGRPGRLWTCPYVISMNEFMSCAYDVRGF